MALEQKLNRGTFEIKTVLALLKKYRYALWVAALGFILLMLPMKEEQTVSAPAETIPQQTESSEDMERRLEDILHCVSGAGRVRVMLTWKDDGQTSYQYDSEIVQSADTTNTRSETVFRSDEGYRQSPLVTKVTAPECLGALIVCTGGDDPTVRLRIVDAVCSLTGLGSDRVTVLKMDGL